MQNTLVFASSEGNPYPDSHITGLTLPPESVDPTYRTVTAGYSNGVIRTYTIFQGSLQLREAQKPHANTAVNFVLFSPDGAYCVTCAEKELFFFSVNKGAVSTKPLLNSIGLVVVEKKINHVCWHSGGDRVLLSLEEGTLAEVQAPKAGAIDTTESFEIGCSYRVLMPEKVEEKVVEEVVAEEGASGRLCGGKEGGAVVENRWIAGSDGK